jgi:hypothetical protein
MASYEDLERRIARLEAQQSTGMMVDTSFGTGLIRPFQNGFPAILTSCFDPNFGYSWAQNYLNDFTPGVEAESNPLAGNEAFTPDNNESLTPGTLGWIETDPQARGYLFIQSPPGFYRYQCIKNQWTEFVWTGSTWQFNSLQGCCGCAASTCLCYLGSGGSGIAIQSQLYFQITGNITGGSVGSGSGVTSGGSVSSGAAGVCLTGTLVQSGNQWQGTVTLADGSTLQLLMGCNANGQLQLMGVTISCDTENECVNGLLSVTSCPGTCTTTVSGGGSLLSGTSSAPSPSGGGTYTTSFCATISLGNCTLADCTNATLLITSDPTFGNCTPCATSGGTSGGGSLTPSGGISGHTSGAGSCGMGFSGIVFSGGVSGGICIPSGYDANATAVMHIGSNMLEFDTPWDGTATYTGEFVGPATGLVYNLILTPATGSAIVTQGGVTVGTGVGIKCAQPGNGNAYVAGTMQYLASPISPGGPDVTQGAFTIILRLCGSGGATSGGGGGSGGGQAGYGCVNFTGNSGAGLCQFGYGTMTADQCATVDCNP